jgi:hypothetical protein
MYLEVVPVGSINLQTICVSLAEVFKLLRHNRERYFLPFLDFGMQSPVLCFVSTLPPSKTLDQPLMWGHINVGGSHLLGFWVLPPPHSLRRSAYTESVTSVRYHYFLDNVFICCFLTHIYCLCMRDQWSTRLIQTFWYWLGTQSIHTRV